MEEVEVEQEPAQQQETEPPAKQDPPVMQDPPARHDTPAKWTPPARKPIGTGSMDAPNWSNCNEDNIIPSQAAEEMQCIQQRWIKETSERDELDQLSLLKLDTNGYEEDIGGSRNPRTTEQFKG